MNNENLIDYVALCPHCNNPFHYKEWRCVGGLNDIGGWLIECFQCGGLFKFQISNQEESYTDKQWQVKEKYYEWPVDNDYPIAVERVRHSIVRHKIDWKYNTNTSSLYVCKLCHEGLDVAAYNALHSQKESLQLAWQNAENYLLAASGPSGERINISIDFKCSCSESHNAIFSANTNLGASYVKMYDRCLLVHISNSDLPYRLNCLASKSEVMELLEKLLIRWHLIFDQVILATPFIGHQWMEPEDIEEIWDWLFKNLDPEKVLLITRSATFKRFKNIQKDSGLDFDELMKYDLEDKIVSSGAKKQDFHAKFFAGISNNFVEVLSGSANLLKGPSIENISFQIVDNERFKKKYLDVLKVHPALQSKSKRAGDVLLFKDMKWTHTTFDRSLLNS